MPRPSRAHPREVAQAQRGMRDAARLGMKPVFLLAFLALGPALANLIPMADPVVEAATATAITGQTQHPAAATVSEAERAWLCGR
jgi:hypothetical protein